jgi:2-polyprenyl-3-methyl-5-hydroxy-6-metoxy-1,4-benzoquinol methylase
MKTMPTTDLIRVPCPLCGDAATRPERTVAGFALERCGGCGFVFVNPQPTNEALGQIYGKRDTDELVRLYSRIQNADVEWQQDRILDLLDRYRPKRGRLLDFGCGAGYFAQRAAQRGWKATGLELGPWCREAAAHRGFDDVVIGSLAEGVFPPASFDVVTANQVLEHLPEPRRDLARIAEVIRPGGLFYANVPNYRCLSIVLGRDDFEHNTPPQHLNYFTPASLAKLARDAGLRVLRVSSYGGLKWENLLGRRTRSSITAAYEHNSSAGESVAAPAARPPLLKRLARPAADLLLYRGAKVGIALEVIAVKPG